MNETTRVRRFLDSLLKADAALVALVGQRIYGDSIPGETAFPYAFFGAPEPGEDTRGVGAVRILTNATWEIKAVDKAIGWTAVEEVADRLDALVHGAAGAAGTDGWVLMGVRERPIDYREDAAGVEYRHLGGLYRLWAQEV